MYVTECTVYTSSIHSHGSIHVVHRGFGPRELTVGSDAVTNGSADHATITVIQYVHIHAVLLGHVLQLFLHNIQHIWIIYNAVGILSVRRGGCCGCCCVGVVLAFSVFWHVDV